MKAVPRSHFIDRGETPGEGGGAETSNATRPWVLCCIVSLGSGSKPPERVSITQLALKSESSSSAVF